jgi:hypothetical protein
MMRAMSAVPRLARPSASADIRSHHCQKRVPTLNRTNSVLS